LDGGSTRRKAVADTGQHNIEKRGHTLMLRAGFEPTIPVSERLKTVRALEHAAIGTGCCCCYCNNNNSNNKSPVAEPEVSAPLIQKPSIVHCPEIIPCICHPQIMSS